MSFFSYAGTYKVNADKLFVRKGPGTTYVSEGVLYRNSSVNVTGEVTGKDGRIWCSIDFQGNTGYVCKEYISEDKIYASSDKDFEAWLNDQQFPETYKNGLRGLHEKYPQWVFYAQHTGLEWDKVIAEESKIGRNLVGSNAISSWKSTADGAFDWGGNFWPGFDGASWVQASEDLIKYYMDPRNFLSDPYIFQFQKQYYDRNTQTKELLANMVKGTFLEAGIGHSSSSDKSSVSKSGYVISSTGPGGNITEDTYGPGSSAGPGSVGSANVDSGIGPGSGPGSAVTEKLEWWQMAPEDDTRWIYVDSDGNRKTDGWFWIDGNHDGIAECYYFDSSGYMLADTMIDGYYVNADGKWLDENGNIETKQVTTSSISETYIDLIMRAADTSGVSPFILTASILQEMGKDGKSDSISGTNSKYPGIYNFYNISAYAHDGMSAIEAGLDFASQSGNADRPWNTIEKAIIGGAKSYAANYLENGQDTIYLKKFNVQGTNLFNHQYMTYIAAASGESANVESAYSGEIKNQRIEFKIPVYLNMPEVNCTQPIIDGNPNNKLSALYVENHQITPSFGMNTAEYSLIVESDVSNINIVASAIDSNASVAGAGNVSLAHGENVVNVIVTAANGSVRTYRISIIRKGESTQTEAGPGSTSAGPSQTDTQSDVSIDTSGNDVFIGPGGTVSDDIVIGTAPM